jgi:hypothetical protein
MKHLTSAFAVLSLFATAPAFASDVSSDRQFAETKALQLRALQSIRATTTAQAPASTEDTKDCARCNCARSDVPRAARAEPGGR